MKASPLKRHPESRRVQSFNLGPLRVQNKAFSVRRATNSHLEPPKKRGNPARHLRFLVLERHVTSEDVGVFHSLLHVRMTSAVIQDKASDQPMRKHAQMSWKVSFRVLVLLNTTLCLTHPIPPPTLNRWQTSELCICLRPRQAALSTAGPAEDPRQKLFSRMVSDSISHCQSQCRIQPCPPQLEFIPHFYGCQCHPFSYSGCPSGTQESGIIFPRVSTTEEWRQLPCLSSEREYHGLEAGRVPGAPSRMQNRSP